MLKISPLLRHFFFKITFLPESDMMFLGRALHMFEDASKLHNCSPPVR